MLRHALLLGADMQTPTPQEGEMYKALTVHGQTFNIYYGYYEQCDRDNPAVDPMPIYPDFQKDPRYTSEGFAYVTKMQDTCRYYRGRVGNNADCADCSYYLHGDELLGVCSCPGNKQTSAPSKNNAQSNSSKEVSDHD